MTISNPYKYNTQNYRLLERLKKGPVSNSEIIRQLNIFNSTGRISEIREYLKGFGLDVVAQSKRGGLYEYRIAGLQRELL